MDTQEEKLLAFIDAKIKGLIKCDVKIFISSEDINKVDT